MPKLEEGNLWVRATLPQDASYETGAKMAHEIREILLGFPAVTQVVSQMGRPDDGTDVTTFNNVEFMVSLKPPNQWPSGLTKDELINQMDQQLEKYPGIDFNFSQNIQDNVEEAMSGVKGENSLKLFGDDIDTLVEKAGEIRDVMATVPGVADLGVFQESGQPELIVSIDRARECPLRCDGRGRQRGSSGGHRRPSRQPRFCRAIAVLISSYATSLNSALPQKPSATFFFRRRTGTTFPLARWLMFHYDKGRS